MLVQLVAQVAAALDNLVELVELQLLVKVMLVV
jgi:hypothetical protein